MRYLGIAAWVVLWSAAVAGAAPALQEVPLFTWRARVATIAGRPPTDKKFTYSFGKSGGAVTSGDDQWSDWASFDIEGAKRVTSANDYPNNYIRGFPVVLHLGVGGVVDPTVVEVEAKFQGSTDVVAMSGELYGPTLGMLLWREADHAPRIATMAQYNRRFWAVLDGVKLTEAQRPKNFPIVDRFIGGDTDRRDWKEGIEALARAGFSAIMLPPDEMLRKLMNQAGLKRTAWAIYSPPGMFGHAKGVTPESIADWAQKLAAPYLKAGYEPTEMASYALSDEPGWYYPAAFASLAGNPQALAQFRQYLKNQKLKPQDLGAAEWDQVLPLGRGGATDLPSKRRFYWTMRFFAWDSERYYADVTAAMEKAFYPGMPIFTNWNNFAGRLFVPGPVANNSAKSDPDAAMGLHDWMEFGRLRGGTMLWTEDWFGDAQAYQWSFYCAKLRSAAALCPSHDVEFGGYVVPRSAGLLEDGILQKIVTIVGSGGKAIQYFVFGPEYNFPSNCYSNNVKVMPKMAEAHGMIAAAEDLLWPGRRVPPVVAILAPRSAEMWDARDIPVPRQIEDATQTNLTGRTVDYMAEVFCLYTALQHANVPVDFVDEDNLTPQGLAKYKVLYVTEPDMPEEGQRGLVEWVKAGGTLVTVSGAAASDRYDEPCNLVGKATGILEKPRRRELIASIGGLTPVGEVYGELGRFKTFGVRGQLSAKGAKVGARFDDTTPAIVRSPLGRGQVFHFAFLPGIAYLCRPQSDAAVNHDGAHAGDGAEALRRWIVYPTQQAGVVNPVVVDHVRVETPMLISDAGAVVTLLNWTNEPIEKLKVIACVPFKVSAVESVKQGRLKFKNTGAGVEFTLRAGSADFVMIRP